MPGFLALPITTDEPDADWRARSRCKGVGPSVMDPSLVLNTCRAQGDVLKDDVLFLEAALENRKRLDAYYTAIEVAKEICSGCGVRNECLEDALQQRERYGVLGGLSTEERGAMLGFRVTYEAEDVAGQRRGTVVRRMQHVNKFPSRASQVNPVTPVATKEWAREWEAIDRTLEMHSIA